MLILHGGSGSTKLLVALRYGIMPSAATSDTKRETRGAQLRDCDRLMTCRMQFTSTRSTAAVCTNFRTTSAAHHFVHSCLHDAISFKPDFCWISDKKHAALRHFNSSRSSAANKHTGTRHHHHPQPAATATPHTPARTRFDIICRHTRRIAVQNRTEQTVKG
jgi:hypothetical protein